MQFPAYLLLPLGPLSPGRLHCSSFPPRSFILAVPSAWMLLPSVFARRPLLVTQISAEMPSLGEPLLVIPCHCLSLQTVLNTRRGVMTVTLHQMVKPHCNRDLDCLDHLYIPCGERHPTHSGGSMWHLPKGFIKDTLNYGCFLLTCQFQSLTPTSRKNKNTDPLCKSSKYCIDEDTGA